MEVAGRRTFRIHTDFQPADRLSKTRNLKAVRTGQVIYL